MRIRTMWLLLAAGLPAQESAPASRPQLPGAQWTDPVRKAVAGADVVRVWSTSRRPERQRFLLEVTDPDSIAQLIAGIAFEDHPSGGFCLCTGQHEIELSRGQERLALLVIHHASFARRDDIALALMEEPQRLRPTHFHAGPSRFEDPERRLAAVEAVVRCRGRFGLEMAFAYRCDSSEERSAVAQSLRRMLLAQDPPGRPLLEEAKSLADLRRWFAQHGQDYLSALK